jgi:hypothetical protein
MKPAGKTFRKSQNPGNRVTENHGSTTVYIRTLKAEGVNKRGKRRLRALQK